MEPEGRPSSEALDVHKQTWSHGSWAPPNVERKRGAEMGSWSWGSSPASLHTGGEQRLYRVGALGRGGGRRSVPVAEEGCVASFTCWKLARQLGAPLGPSETLWGKAGILGADEEASKRASPQPCWVQCSSLPADA